MADNKHLNSLSLDVLTLQAYQDVLIEHVKPSDVLPALASTRLRKDMEEIMVKQGTEGSKKGMELLITKLIQYSDRHLVNVFGIALKDNGYELVQNVLNDHSDVKQQQVYNDLINIMFVQLKENINPLDLLDYLKIEGVLGESDCEEIKAATARSGNHMGALTLLTNIGRRHEDWFPVLMYALLTNKYEHLVKEIDAKFAEAGSLDDMKLLCEKWKAQRGDMSTSESLDDIRISWQNLKPHKLDESASSLEYFQSTNDEQSIDNKTDGQRSEASTYSSGFLSQQTKDHVCSCGKKCKNAAGLKIHQRKMKCQSIANTEQSELECLQLTTDDVACDDNLTDSLQSEASMPSIESLSLETVRMVCSCGKVCKNEKGLKIHQGKMKCQPISSAEQHKGESGEMKDRDNRRKKPTD